VAVSLGVNRSFFEDPGRSPEALDLRAGPCRGSLESQAFLTAAAGLPTSRNLATSAGFSRTCVLFEPVVVGPAPSGGGYLVAGLQAVNRLFSELSADPRKLRFFGLKPGSGDWRANSPEACGRAADLSGQEQLRQDYQGLASRPIPSSPPRSERRRLSICPPGRRQQPVAKNLTNRRHVAYAAPAFPAFRGMESRARAEGMSLRETARRAAARAPRIMPL